MRRTVQRFNNLVDNRRTALTSGQPRDSPTQLEGSASQLGQSVVDQLQLLTKRFREFTMQWARAVGKQQSPLIDRIPPRGVELWRDFWDTVRKQVRRINQEFWQVSRDMTRMITGRLPAGVPRQDGKALLYSATHLDQELLARKFQEFYDKLGATLSEEQAKMDGALSKLRAQSSAGQTGNGQATAEKVATNDDSNMNLIDELDDEATKNELIRNVALRQQIQQEINVFGSIFDIMRAFIQRLRDSASVFRDVLQPGAPNNNDAVTPGPSIKPTVDQLLEDTINSQRNINGQAKPVLLPNDRPQQQG